MVLVYHFIISTSILPSPKTVFINPFTKTVVIKTDLSQFNSNQVTPVLMLMLLMLLLLVQAPKSDKRYNVYTRVQEYSQARRLRGYDGKEWRMKKKQGERYMQGKSW